MNTTLSGRGQQAGDVSVWRPRNLDVDRLLKSWGERVAEGVLWLGHCVYANLADDARCRETGQVPLMAEYLRNVVGRHHLDVVRKAARQIGYVDRDRSYRAGIRSQAYWILPPYDLTPLVRREIISSGLRHNIRAWRESQRRATWQRIQRNETSVDAAVCTHLWRNLQRIRLDAAIDCGEAFHPTYQIAAERIWLGDLRLKVDDYGRIHTNLTNLPRALRQFLSVEDERLANVDISESQPLFVGLALARGREEERANRQEKPKQREGREEEGRKGKAGRAPPSLMLDNTMLDTHPQLDGGFDRTRLPADLRRYLELCEAGSFYQTVADRLGKTRNETKKSVMVVFYDKPEHRNRVSAVLDELSPTVMRNMREIKRPDYRRLAHFAQRIESAFMFGRVVPRLMKLNPGLFISTIHDSIVTTARDAPLVRQVMLDEFARLGLSPQVKLELCSTL